MTNLAFHPDGLTKLQSIEDFYRQFYSCLTDSRGNILELDLSDVPFIRPGGIVALITVGRVWQRQCGGYILITKIQPQVYAYLERMNLFVGYGDLFNISGNIMPSETYSRSYPRKSLLEILPISGYEPHNTDCVHSAVTRAKDILEGWYGNNSNVKRLCTVFSEILTNIVHSEDDGYALIQSYQDNAETGKRVELAVGDPGIGIQASLLSNQQIVEEAARKKWVKGSNFILYALAEGISSKVDISNAGRGVGLTVVRQKVGEWEQGLLRIRSGNSMIEFIHNQDEPQIFDELTTIPGTQVVISISAKVFGVN